MSIRDRSYWIERTKEKVLWNEKQADDAVKEIMFIFDETAFEVENKINALYQKFAEDNSITLNEARKLISGKEYSVWRMSIEKYLSEIDSNSADSKLVLELNTLAMKSRISREEKLLADIYRQMAELADDCETNLTELLSDVTTSNYYRGCYNLQVGIKAGFEVSKISDQTIKALLDYNWSGKKFSKAVWDNVDAICAHAKRAIMRGFTSGAGVQKMAKEIDDVMGKGRYVAERLVRTECKYFANQGELLAYKECGIDQYVFMGGTEGSISCDCAFYNGKIIPVSEAEPGINFPPLHPNCKCSIRAYIENGVLDDKDCVPLSKSPSYDEWREQFVKETGKDLPYHHDAIIPQEKFTQYCLNKEKAPDKAHAFESALGYTLDNYQDLIDNIYKSIPKFPAKNKGDNGYGISYEVLMTLTGANHKKANVKTGWIIRYGSKEPTLTSAYVTKKKLISKE